MLGNTCCESFPISIPVATTSGNILEAPLSTFLSAWAILYLRRPTSNGFCVGVGVCVCCVRMKFTGNCIMCCQHLHSPPFPRNRKAISSPSSSLSPATEAYFISRVRGGGTASDIRLLVLFFSQRQHRQVVVVIGNTI